MAVLKSETLHRSYKGRIRPVTHYTLGWLPLWARMATRAGKLVNRILSVSAVEKLVLFAGGMDTRRSIPRFAEKPFRRWFAARDAAPESPESAPALKRVVIWADSLSDNFSPEVGQAAVALLEAQGYRVFVPTGPACCGLTWISTGQLDTAKRKLEELVETLHPFVAEGIPILGLEPSCTAVLRSDMLDLLPDSDGARAIAAATVTLAELLTADDDWERPDLTGQHFIVQPHCHQYAIMGYEKDLALLESLGATTEPLAGCCGLAGNFGLERGHYDVSVKVAENALLPALRAAAPGTRFLADGLSCRTQASQLAGIDGIHLAQVLAGTDPA
jgi:Fe-S oxidoreductase